MAGTPQRATPRLRGRGVRKTSLRGAVPLLLAQSPPVFHRETTIFMQIRGKKRFTLWHPADIGNLCMHPHAHPALRQSQADMGEGVGVDCPAFARAHNRSVELGAAFASSPLFDDGPGSRPWTEHRARRKARGMCCFCRHTMCTASTRWRRPSPCRTSTQVRTCARYVLHFMVSALLPMRSNTSRGPKPCSAQMW